MERCVDCGSEAGITMICADCARAARDAGRCSCGDCRATGCDAECPTCNETDDRDAYSTCGDCDAEIVNGAACTAAEHGRTY